MEWLLSSYLSSSYRGEEAEKNAKQTSAATIFRERMFLGLGTIEGVFAKRASARTRVAGEIFLGGLG